MALFLCETERTEHLLTLKDIFHYLMTGIITRQMLLHMGASLSPFVAIITFSVTACNVNSGITVCM